jgi:hypothetical protein
LFLEVTPSSENQKKQKTVQVKFSPRLNSASLLQK